MRHGAAKPFRPSNFFFRIIFSPPLMGFAAPKRIPWVKAVERLPRTDNYLIKEKNRLEKENDSAPCPEINFRRVIVLKWSFRLGKCSEFSDTGISETKWKIKALATRRCHQH
jgi:hypothetical protein